MRGTESGGSVDVIGDLYQLTSRVQRTMPRDFVQVSVFAARRSGGSGGSEALLDGGPKFAASDDGCIAITLAGAGTGGINIQANIAASDIHRATRTEVRDGIGAKCVYYPLRRERVIPVILLCRTN